ncbi:hypothetical protein BJX64DRAFT_288904 [Aspergillus heterothallicus]
MRNGIAERTTHRRKDLDELLEDKEDEYVRLHGSAFRSLRHALDDNKPTFHRRALEKSSRRGPAIPQCANQPELVQRPPEYPPTQAIWNQESCTDTTVHFEMDVGEDVGALLEEFSRLKRLRDFQAADQYFQETLLDFVDLLPVTIKYADMLVEQGASHQELQVQDLWVEANPTDQELNTFLYKANLRLIHAFESIHLYVNMSMEDGIVQIFRYALKILSRLEKETDVAPEGVFDYWAKCDHLDTSIVSSGRVWDARDLIYALIKSEGASNS